MKTETETEAEIGLPTPEIHHQLQRESLPHAGEWTADNVYQSVSESVGATPEQRMLFARLLRDLTHTSSSTKTAGAGTGSTMLNSFVQPIGDTMSGRDADGYPGIMDALKQATETMRRGGCVGYEFSRIRPMGAKVEGTKSRARGPMAIMRIFDVVCTAIDSAGAGRDTQMGVMRIDHPDIASFIDARRIPEFGKLGLDAAEEAVLMSLANKNTRFCSALKSAFSTLTNFNISCSITDEFMRAVESDSDFDLVHVSPPADRPSAPLKRLEDGTKVFVYERVRARDLWDRIMCANYNAVGPGVVFIDQVNRENSLRYAETIEAINSNGEALPPYGCCESGAMMLSRFVLDPFSERSRFDWTSFKKAIAPAVQFLDRLLDEAEWPLPEQKVEATTKRRLGLGFDGLADALDMLGIRYDSQDGVNFGASVAEVLRDEAYAASVVLAGKRGAFPLFNADRYLDKGTFASRLPKRIQEAIRKHGIRNSHLLSISTKRTLAMTADASRSFGFESKFSFVQERVSNRPDGSNQGFFPEKMDDRTSKHPYDAEADTGSIPKNLSIDAQLNMLLAVAPYLDSAMTMSVIIPGECAFTEFKDVYMQAWKARLKGIKTHRNFP
ncbi:Ribonucleoside-diphosphate reductase NrdZ [Hydrogenophaga sp. T4]|nr:Ribonucleoside-diphosphate reductase NrdZ [Hydrogenophaga sp. T4]